MKSLITATIAVLLFTITTVSRSSGQESVPADSQNKPLVVFLVRHAEKVDASRDPKLSAAGQERADVLAKTLRSSEIEHVHSSDYVRTRKTAAPFAKKHELKTDLYNPRDLPALVEKLRKTGGRHLVVGHSNTTPKMVELLGGKPGAEINEKSEYDRLYIVTIGKDGTVTSVLMRYGKAFDR